MASTTTVTPNYHPIDLEGLLKGPPAKVNEKDNSVTASLVVDCRCKLGECVLYDDRKNAVVFENILEKTFHKLDLNNPTAPLETYKLEKMLCAFALLDVKNGNEKLSKDGYLAAWEDGFQLFDLEHNEALGDMSQGESVHPLGLPDRLNDGRVDPTGRFFICGGHATNPGPLKVFRCGYDAKTQQLSHTPVVDTIQTTNSICWSLDGKTMYLADSPTLKIHQYDYDNGSLSNKRLFHDKPFGVADGSCVDAEGFVWNATWRSGAGTGVVHRLDPQTGEVVFAVNLPDETSEASCCCFGGPDLDILFITTAWENLDPKTEPHAGGLYAVKLPNGMKGLQEKRFQIN